MPAHMFAVKPALRFVRSGAGPAVTRADIAPGLTTCTKSREFPRSCAPSERLCNVALRRRLLFHPSPRTNRRMPKRKINKAAPSAPPSVTPDPPAPSDAPASFWARFDRTWLHLCVIAGVAAAVFANSLKNSFHLDDYYRVVDNPGITQISRPWLHFVDPTTMSTLDRIAGYRPFLPLTLSINYAIAGDSVVSYHIGNLAMQIAAAWLVYRLVWKLLELAPASSSWRFEPTRARAIALCVALVFAVHPVSGIPVNYICARDQLLSQVFWGASLLVYLRMHQRGFSIAGWAGALVLLFASLLSKGDAVSAPALIFALNVTVLAQPFRARRPWLHAALFVIPVAGLFLLQLQLFGNSEVDHVVAANVSRGSYFLTQAQLHLFRYLPQFFWPFSIQQDPAVELATGLSFRVACGLLFLATTLGMAWLWRREHPIWSFCILAYWISIAPTSSIIPLHAAAVDYRPYPSSPYLFLGLALAALRIRLPIRVPIRPLLASGAVLWCAGTSVVLNRVWLNDVTLWSYSIEHGGGPLSYLDLAMATPELKPRRALLEHALKLHPGYLLVMVNLGRTLVAQGENDKGLEYLQRAARLGANDAQIRYWYARTLYEVKRYPEANRESAAAVRLAPKNGRGVYQAVLAAQAVGDHREALRLLDVADGLHPKTDEADFTRGFSLQQLGKLDEAIATYHAFLEGHPKHAQAHFNLAFALMTQRQCGLAMPEFERALQLNPAMAAAHLHLATCARAVGNATVAQLHQASWEKSQVSKRR
jgi:tetratricopeptide (TPR) repeat protein